MRATTDVRRVALVLAFAAACGGKPATQEPIEERGGGGGRAISEHPDVILQVLAAAAANDDGATLDSLIHPDYGAWVWTQPGAYVVPTTHLTAGEAVPPSKRFAPDDVNDYWRESLWPTVSAAITSGLKVMDENPADRNDPKYGTCDDGGDGSGSAQRTWLAPDSFSSYQDEVLAEANVTLDPAMRKDLLHYHQWGLDVWLMNAERRWWVAHVMVWTPCDA